MDVCVVWLVGQVMTRRVTEVVSPSPMCWTRGLPARETCWLSSCAAHQQDFEIAVVIKDGSSD